MGGEGRWEPDGGRIVKIGRGRWRERGIAPGVSEPVRASSRCAVRSHQVPDHRFSRAHGLLVLLGLSKERKSMKYI